MNLFIASGSISALASFYKGASCRAPCMKFCGSRKRSRGESREARPCTGTSTVPAHRCSCSSFAVVFEYGSEISHFHPWSKN